MHVLMALVVSAAAGDAAADLRLDSANGCAIVDGRAVLWGQVFRCDRGVLYLEAEGAERLSFQKGKAAVPEADCGGGAYVAFVTHAEFPLRIDKAGQYQGWARCFLPFPGSWTHMESMDGGRQNKVRDSTRWIFGKWFWTQLGAYRLRKGSHRFVLHNWLGGARLDAVVFSRDPAFDPIGAKGQPPTGLAPGVGEVTTVPLRPSGVAEWRRLDVDATLNGGRVTAEVSADGGKTWRPAVRLADLKPSADGSDTLVARVTLHASGDGRSPELRGARVRYAVAPGAEAAIENAHYRIAVAVRSGRLCGLWNKATRTPATPLHLQSPLVGLAVREPGAPKQTVIAPDQMRFDGLKSTGRSLALDYSAVDGQVRVRVVMTADDSPLCRWRCTVDNRSKLEVIRLDFPVIGAAAIGDFRDDECVIPHAGGRRIRNPARDKTWNVTYLGGGSMSWLDLCDSSAGLYVAMLDKRLTTTEMECAPADSRTAVDLAMRTHTLVKPGQSRSREYVVGVHRGDWHWAADRYREWAGTWMAKPRSPRWVKWTDGWVHGSGKLTFDAMADFVKLASQDGIDYLQYWGHMADGGDQCCGNFYWPAPALGGLDGFRRGVEQVHKLGGRVTAYMNCQTWTPDSATNPSLRRTPKSDLPAEAIKLIHPKSWFEKWRLYPLDGKPVGYYARKFGWAIMCPASTGFREHLRYWIVDVYARRLRADGIYLDQTGATRAKPCYNLGHGHNDIGAWGAGNVAMLKTCVEQARRHNPDFILAIEGAGDALGQYADLHLTSGMCTHPEVYHYTFPDHIQISGRANSSHLSHKQRVSRAFLNGDRFDSFVGDRLMASALALRRRVKRWLYPGRFMDTLGLTVSDERLLARWTRCEDGGQKAIVLTFDNEDELAGATCTLELPDGWRAPRSLHVFDREGGVRAAKPAVAEGKLSFTVPASTLSTALVLYAATPAEQVDAWCAVPAVAGDAPELDVRAANYGAEPVTATVTLEAAPPLKAADGELRLAVPAGGAARRAVALTGVDKLTGPTPVSLCVSWPGGTRRRTAVMRPLLVNGPLDLDIDRDGTPDGWRPAGTIRTFEHGIEDGAWWIQAQPKQFTFLIQIVPLRPETTYRFAARIRRSVKTKNIYAAVVENLTGRGLRVHPIGRGEDLPAGRWQRFETTFTTGKTFRNCGVYLYCTNGTARAWFDDVELRPVR